MTVKERLHQLVEELPEGQATDAAERALLTRRGREDPFCSLCLVPRSMMSPRLTKSERQAEGRAALERGDVVSDEELRRKLGF